MDTSDDRESATRAKYWQINAIRDGLRVRPVWRPYQKFMESLADLRGKKLLDFGAGIQSPVVDRFRRANGSLEGYHAYDIDAGAIAKWRNEGKYYDFFADDAGAGSFDIIYADNAYEHLTLPLREAFVGRAARLLRPRGTLLVVFPHISNLNIIEHFERDRTHLMVAREHEAAFIASFGFTPRVYIAGLTFPYKPAFFSIAQFLRNVLLGYYPQTMVIIVAERA